MLMHEAAGEAEISAYLEDIATNHMGMPTPALADNCTRAAASLVRLKRSFEGH